MQKLDFIFDHKTAQNNNYENNIFFIIIILGQESRILEKLRDLKTKKTKEKEEETLNPNPYYF